MRKIYLSESQMISRFRKSKRFSIIKEQEVKKDDFKLNAEYVKKKWDEYSKKYEKELKYLADK